MLILGHQIKITHQAIAFFVLSRAPTARILRKSVRAICQGLIPFTFSSYSHLTAAFLPVLLTISSGAIMSKCKLPSLEVLHHFPKHRSRL